MKSWINASLLAAVLALTGCAGTPQSEVALAPGSLSAQSGRVGVAMTTIPKVDTMFPGADCLLCLAAASIANASLTSYAQTLPTDDLAKLKLEVADLVRKKGANVMLIDESINLESLPDWNTAAPNIAKKDFTSLKKKYAVDKLLLMEVSSVNIRRNYASYFPTGEPYVILQGAGYLVNLNNNSYEWYTWVHKMKNGDGKWDEPPSYPGLTNTYYQVIEMSRDAYLKPFKN